MKLFDAKLARNKGRYIGQCLLATASAMVVLLVLDAMSNAAIIASLGASCFIAFTMPHGAISSPRYLVGGYVVGLAVGTGCYWLGRMPLPDGWLLVHHDVLFGALAIGLATFIMVVTNTEHPPAAGVALGLVLQEWSLLTVVVVLVGIVLLSLIKRLLKPLLVDLL